MCPGVNSRTGRREPLLLPKVIPRLPPARPLPSSWRQTVLEITALFESGVRNVETAYTNVSSTDVMSLGFLQWNHNAGSLYSGLLAGLGVEAVAADRKLTHFRP